MSKRDDIETLTMRVAQLESQVAQLGHFVAATQPLLQNTGRLSELAEHAERLGQAAGAKLRDLREQAAPHGIGKPRFEVTLNNVYHADTAGYVSMVFYSGRTGTVQVLAGSTNPPTEAASFAGDQYIGAFIRRGEYWMVVSRQHGVAPSFNGMFTPLY